MNGIRQWIIQYINPGQSGAGSSGGSPNNSFGGAGGNTNVFNYQPGNVNNPSPNTPIHIPPPNTPIHIPPGPATANFIEVPDSRTFSETKIYDPNDPSGGTYVTVKQITGLTFLDAKSGQTLKWSQGA